MCFWTIMSLRVVTAAVQEHAWQPDGIKHVADVAGVGGAREVLVDLLVGVLVETLEHLCRV